MTLQIQSILIIILLKTFKCIIMSYLIPKYLVNIIIICSKFNRLIYENM